MKIITLYSKDNCPYCVLAKNLLTSLGVEFEEIDITQTPGLIMDLVKKSWMRTVPQIFFGEVCLGGYTDIASLHEKGKLVQKIEL